MVRSVRDALVRALVELVDEDLISFCNTIRDWEIKDGYNKIPRSRLHKKGAEEVVDVIRDFYKDQYGAELTVAVLNDINQKKVAQELEENLSRVPGFAGCKEKTKEAPGGPASNTKQHFVDKHQIHLIGRVTAIDAILDLLQAQKLIDQEAYDTIQIKETSQKKMRKLYFYMRGWGDRHKDVFYNVLLTCEPCLMEDLQKPH